MVETIELGEDVIDGVGVDEQIHVGLRRKPLVATGLHHLYEAVEIMVDVEQRDGLLVNVELTPRQHGGEFFESPEATRQDDKGVGLTQHFVLAFVHGGGFDEPCDVRFG